MSSWDIFLHGIFPDGILSSGILSSWDLFYVHDNLNEITYYMSYKKRIGANFQATMILFYIL